jgi:hypothetical protein
MGAPRRKALLGVGVAVLLAAGTVFVLTRGEGGPADTDGLRGSSPTQTGEDVAGSETPSFRFNVEDRDVVATEPGRVSKRDRKIALGAAETVRSLVTDLYVEAFLDPGSWGSGTYDDVFRAFAGGATAEARERAGALTAGADAAERFDLIEPIGGRLALRVLVDRTGKPTLVASVVRFRARGTGEEPTVIRSEGSFLFRRVEGAWRIVSFQVERADRRTETA